MFGLTVSPDGSVIVADSYAPEGSDKKVRVWDAATLEVRSEFSIDREFTLAAAGGEWVAHVDPSPRTAGGAGRLRVHDIDTGAIVAEPKGEFFTVSDQLDESSMLLTTDRTGDVIVFDTTTRGRWWRGGPRTLPVCVAWLSPSTTPGWPLPVRTTLSGSGT